MRQLNSQKRMRHGFLMVMVSLSVLVGGCATTWLPTFDSENGIPVRFNYTASNVNNVSLAGSFNGWTPSAMTRKGDSWSITLHLPPERYQYVFVVDDTEWKPDPGALLSEDNGFGGRSSILVVE